MRKLLSLHPESRSFAPAQQVEVEISRSRTDQLVLFYTLTGKMSDIRVPAVTRAARSDQLWRHTCFEAFVRTLSGEEYYEFNFAPSTQWAAYRFSSYRSGMSVAPKISTPSIEVRLKPDRLTLRATLELGHLMDLPDKTLWRVGLSALIEDMNGRKSYWALAHPPGKPDFHHADCFVYELPPP